MRLSNLEKEIITNLSATFIGFCGLSYLLYGYFAKWSVAHDFGGYWTVFQCLYIGLAHLVVAKSALFEKKCDDMLIRLSVFVLVAIAISSLIGGMIWAFYGLFIPLFISGLYSLCLYVAAKKALSIKPVT